MILVQVKTPLAYTWKNEHAAYQFFKIQIGLWMCLNNIDGVVSAFQMWNLRSIATKMSKYNIIGAKPQVQILLGWSHISMCYIKDLVGDSSYVYLPDGQLHPLYYDT